MVELIKAQPWCIAPDAPDAAAERIDDISACDFTADAKGSKTSSRGSSRYQ